MTLRRLAYLQWFGILGGGAIPFTQVWIRPKLDDSMAGFKTVPDSGVGPQTLSWLPGSSTW